MNVHDPIDTASSVLLDAAGADGQFGRLVRNPDTGERGLVIAVRGAAVDDLLHSIKDTRRPNLLRRVAASLAWRGDAD